MTYLIILLTLMAVLLIWDSYRINRLEKTINDYFNWDDDIFTEICKKLEK